MDHNATTPVVAPAAEAVARALALVGNPSSVHAGGRASRAVIEDARESVAALAGCGPSEVVFTSGATEANNLALRGCGRAVVLASAVEHVSVLEAAPDLRRVPVDGEGRVDLGALEVMLAEIPAPAVVSVMIANNETGVLQPVAQVSSLARAHGALVHCDAVQGAAKMRLEFAALGVDMMSLSAHKMGGPMGAGALIVRDGLDLEAIVRGGGQERNRRGGTENLPGIAGFGAAAAAADHDAHAAEMTALRDALEDGVRAIAPEAVVFGAQAARLANTTCVAMPGVVSETQVMALDLDGIAVSAGAACSSGKVARSHVLDAMGVDPALAECAIRVSLGPGNTAEDVQRFLDAWGALYARTRSRAA